ncbi:unnamed protein product [Tilletia controversa]|uniref:Uncharacterized protein n=1 Tax=Tilletia caries TaxID=13290 RepID=A0ABN7J362_9BASI|nr:unnamed protein product [Tilletia caries]CAD6910167.1 unnamed protein product [Tilletia controversa]CAD6929197.1 unnamed protein product [Tilletia laevis]CAD6935760.1 unnamed protein product [Tilletia controversa]CAD6943878.1 unnamed protein product [Tilletia caries]
MGSYSYYNNSHQLYRWTAGSTGYTYISTGYANPITPVSSTTTALTIPDGAPTNTLPDISFTAGASDKTALLSLGSAGGIVTIYSGDAVVGTSAFSCPTLSPAIFPFDIQ